MDVDAADEDSGGSPATDLLGTFPTTDQTVSQSFLKEIMLALWSSIQHRFTSTLNVHKVAIDDLGDRLDHTETKMAEFSVVHNGLVD